MDTSEDINQTDLEIRGLREEIRGLKTMISRINERVLPGEMDSVDCLREILSQHSRMLAVLRKLTSVPGWSLSDAVYDVREREGLGWEGPAVKQFGEAVEQINRLLQEMKGVADEVGSAPRA